MPFPGASEDNYLVLGVQSWLWTLSLCGRYCRETRGVGWGQSPAWGAGQVPRAWGCRDTIRWAAVSIHLAPPTWCKGSGEGSPDLAPRPGCLCAQGSPPSPAPGLGLGCSLYQLSPDTDGGLFSTHLPDADSAQPSSTTILLLGAGAWHLGAQLLGTLASGSSAPCPAREGLGPGPSWPQSTSSLQVPATSSFLSTKHPLISTALTPPWRRWEWTGLAAGASKPTPSSSSQATQRTQVNETALHREMAERGLPA